MSARFWVSGSGTWDASDTSHWSATSGGASGASVPTSSDDVYFDGSSGSGTCTVTGFNAPCRNFDCNGYTGTLTAGVGGGMWIYAAAGGTVRLGAGMTLGAITLGFLPAAGANATFTTNGKTVSTWWVSGSGAGGVTLADANTVTGPVQLFAGTLNTNGQTCNWGSFSSSNSNTRTLTLGASALTATGTGTVWDCGTSTNLTVTANTATITLSTASSTARTFAGGGKTYGTLRYTVAASTGTLTLTGANTFGTITLDGGSRTLTLPSSTTTTVTNFVAAGTAGNLITLNASTPGTYATLAKAGGGYVYGLDYLSISDIHAT